MKTRQALRHWELVMSFLIRDIDMEVLYPVGSRGDLAHEIRDLVIPDEDIVIITQVQIARALETL